MLASFLTPRFYTIYLIYILFLFQLATKPGFPESLQQLIEMIKNPAANTSALSASNAGKDDKARQSRDNKVIGDMWFSCTVVSCTSFYLFFP